MPIHHHIISGKEGEHLFSFLLRNLRNCAASHHKITLVQHNRLPDGQSTLRFMEQDLHFSSIKNHRIYYQYA